MTEQTKTSTPNENGTRTSARMPQLRDLGKISCRHCGNVLISGGMLIEPLSIKIATGTQLTVWQLAAVVIGEHAGKYHSELAVKSNAVLPELINNMAMIIAAGHVRVTGAKSPSVDISLIADNAILWVEEMLDDFSEIIITTRELVADEAKGKPEPNPLSDPPPQPPPKAA